MYRDIYTHTRTHTQCTQEHCYVSHVSCSPCLTFTRKHSGAVLDVACCPKGHYLASGSVDHTVCVWRLKKLYADNGLAQKALLGAKVRLWTGMLQCIAARCSALQSVVVCVLTSKVRHWTRVFCCVAML